ncbi:class I adenylate-forming enzyme family protein [Hyphomonas sp. CACIAM 19H1]|uniref:class I adenylate-forming enzyme family protein n=1 Tax=Hyphomonas sp. CACIAM 19H1 TaxID=1873716 RepID=UPI001F1D4342|nr:AMP-binding protein [Hyphomonas sp. CACIAM 19H1]
MQTINDAIHWWARVMPDAVALDFGDDRVTYLEYRDWSERIAADLIKRGLQPGDRVGICAANSLEYCVLILGILRAGGIVLPMNMRYTPHELAEIAEDTGPRFIFADADRLAKIEGLSSASLEISHIGQLRHGQRPIIAHQPKPDDRVVIISTSGSTAKPKGVVFSHRSMTGYVATHAIEEQSLGRGSRVIIPAPLNTSAGFVQLTHYTILGCTLHFLSAFEPALFLKTLVEKKINGFGAVPVFFEAVSKLPEFENADLSSITMATCGGAPVTQALQDTWMKKGIVLRQIYGQTECGGNGTIMPEHLARVQPQKCGMGGLFNEIGIIDENGNRVPPGTVGQIILRGPGNMLEYWNNPEETAKVLKGEWLHTGDLGVLDEDGLLTFIDRMKDLIISGGLNISAAEVERAVLTFPGIEECMVIAAKDAKFGETPLAVVYTRQDIDVPALISHCNSRLADYKVPRYVALEHEPLPRTPTGKLSKPAMREKYRNAAEALPRVR